jgi:hypothetical protein
MEQESKTLNEITKDEIFISIVKQESENMFNKRRLRPSPKEGYFYKRDWYDRMKESGEDNYKFILENIENVLSKKSYINSEKRSIVKYIGEISINKYVKTLNEKTK